MIHEMGFSEITLIGLFVDTHSHTFLPVSISQPTSVTHTCYLRVYVYTCVCVEWRNSSAGNVTLVPRIAVSLKPWKL